MCATCERVRSDSRVNHVVITARGPGAVAFLEAHLAATVLAGWFAGLAEGRYPKLADIPVDQLCAARDHAERARQQLDLLVAGRSQ